MPGREEMLERIRKALGHPAEESANPPEGRLPPPRLEAVMPHIAPADMLPKFEAELEKVAGKAYRASTPKELEEALRAILASCQTTGVVLSRNPLLAQLGIEERLRAWGKPVALWPGGHESDASGRLPDFKGSSFEAAMGITGVDFALAETGTLVLTSLTEGSQLASLAPPVHVALYRRSQLIASIDDLLEKLPVSRDPGQLSPGRSVVFITGTSRTADIEQILIRGVHGPREVHAILVEDSCLKPS